MDRKTNSEVGDPVTISAETRLVSRYDAEMRMLGPALLLTAACGGATPPSTVSDVDVTMTSDTSIPMVATAPPQREVPAPPAAAENDASVCAGRADTFGPVTLDATQASRRRGATTQKFGDTPSSPAKPIEVCGVAAEQTWLMGVSCADGSKAFANRNDVRAARAGNVGGGGLCDSIIDRYVATCPEASYEVFLDMYMCGPGESLK